MGGNPEISWIPPDEDDVKFLQFLFFSRDASMRGEDTNPLGMHSESLENAPKQLWPKPASGDYQGVGWP